MHNPATGDLICEVEEGDKVSEHNIFKYCEARESIPNELVPFSVLNMKKQSNVMSNYILLLTKNDHVQT